VTWPWWEAVLVFLVGNVVLGAATVAALVGLRDDAPAQVVAGLAADLVFLAAMLGWLGRRHPGWRARVGLVPRLRELPIGFGAGLLLYPVIAFVAGFALTWLFEQAAGHPIRTPEQLSSSMPAPFPALAVVFAVVVAPVTEELFFRGMLYRSIRDRLGVLAGVALSSAGFGLVHFLPDGQVAGAMLLVSLMVFTGIGFAVIYEWRGNLLASIAAHAAFNTIGVIAIFAGW